MADSIKSTYGNSNILQTQLTINKEAKRFHYKSPKDNQKTIEDHQQFNEIMNKTVKPIKSKQFLTRDTINKSSIENIDKLNHSAIIQQTYQPNDELILSKKHIKELRDIIDISDNKINEIHQYYKEKIDKHIQDNKSLNETIFALNNQLTQKANDIREYKTLIQQYQDIFDTSKQSIKDKDNDISFSYTNQCTTLLISSKLEKLKSENMFLSNDIKKLQIENCNNQSLNSLLQIELNKVKEDLIFKEKHISLLEKRVCLGNSYSLESNGILAKLNKSTAENLILKNQLEKQKSKLQILQSQLDNSQIDTSEIIKLKSELFAKQTLMTDLSLELSNIWEFIKVEYNKLSNIDDETIIGFLLNDCSTIHLLGLLKYFLRKISQLTTEINSLNERYSCYKEDIDNYRLEVEIMKDQIKEKNIECIQLKDNSNETAAKMIQITSDNTLLHEKIKEMIIILTQTQSEYEKESQLNITLEREMQEIKLLNSTLTKQINSYKDSLIDSQKKP